MGKTFEKKLPYKKAICYSGYREGQCPTGEMPSKEQISEDLHLLVADGYGYIRMYEPRIWMQSPMRSTSSVFIPILICCTIISTFFIVIFNLFYFYLIK